VTLSVKNLSLVLVPFDRPYTSSYYSFIATMSISHTVYEIYTCRPISYFPKHKEVRQGSVLSPYLFNIYLDDVARLNDCCKRTFVIIYAQSASVLKSLLRVFERELLFGICRSRDIIGASKFKLDHVTRTMPPLRVICHPYAGT